MLWQFRPEESEPVQVETVESTGIVGGEYGERKYKQVARKNR